MKRFIGVLAVAISCAFNSCAPTNPDSIASAPGTAVGFSTEIKPLLESNCLPCHHSETLLGGLSLESRTVAFRTSENGTSIVPGSPDTSLVYTKTDARHGEQTDVMPADGILLDEAQRDLLRRWIEQGADWPSGPEGRLTPLKIVPGEA